MLRRYRRERGVFVPESAVDNRLLRPSEACGIHPYPRIMGGDYGQVPVFVAGGANGTIIFSNDGTNWTRAASPTSAEFHDAAIKGRELAIIVGVPNAIVTSPNGRDWTLRSSARYTDFIEVDYYNGVFIAAGNNGSYSNTSGIIQRSLDGVSWSDVTPAGGVGAVEGIGSGNGLFVIGGWNGFIRTSSDGGLTWTSRSSPTSGTIEDFTYGAAPGLYLGVCTNGKVFTSSNGVSWTTRLSASVALWGAAYIDELGLFIVVGDAGAIYTSPNGTTWTQRSSGTTRQLCEVDYGQGLATAVGASGTVITSPDGINWTARSSGVSAKLFDVAS